MYLADMGWELDLYCSEYRPVEGFYKHGNEPSGSMKAEKYFRQLSDYQPLNKDSAQCYQYCISRV
jgi:hypothetical protein